MLEWLFRMLTDKSGIPDEIDQSLYFAENCEKSHITYGCGLHLAMNQNFVIAADIGFPIKKMTAKWAYI